MPGCDFEQKWRVGGGGPVPLELYFAAGLPYPQNVHWFNAIIGV